MKKSTFHGIVLVLGLLFFAQAIQAQITVYTATLSGAAESPPNASPGTGTATITLNTVANTMRVQCAFSGLMGNTTNSHIHAATAVANTGNAGVATQTPSFSGFPLGVTSGTYDQTFDMTQASSYNAAYITANGGTVASAFAALKAAADAGKAYFNIHTSMFPGGEIRGFLTNVCSSGIATVNDLGDAPDATPGDGVCSTSGGTCTLRAAIMETNALPCSPLTVNFSINGIIDLGTALPNLNHPNLTITGPGASNLTVRRSPAGGTPNFSIFIVNSGKVFNLSGLKVTNGNASFSGGALFNNGGITTINACEFIGNASTRDGGALTNQNGTMNVSNSIIKGNAATTFGGGLLNVSNGAATTTTLTNCLISGNTAPGAGTAGGVDNSGNNGTATVNLVNCTVTLNTGSGGGSFGGIISYNNGATTVITLKNTIISGNVGTQAGGNGTITSLGNNLSSDGTGNLNASGDKPNTNPLFVSATDLHLQPCSPAINAGTNAGAPANDLDGNTRPFAGIASIVDMGAYEFQGNPIIVSAPTITQPTCALPAGGIIVVNATGTGTLEYSINNGTNWQTSATFSGLSAGNYNIKVRLQATPSCEAAYTSNPVVLNSPFTASTTTDTWTGCISTNWAVAGNWADGTVPTAADDVTIPAAPTNQPIIGAGTVAVAKSVLINASASLTINATGSLAINGSTGFAFENFGTLDNMGTIRIGNITSVANQGIVHRNGGTLNNKLGGLIQIDRTSAGEAFYTSGIVNNDGTVTIGSLAAVVSFGVTLESTGVFNNNVGGTLNIDRSSSAGMLNFGLLNNYGAVNIGLSANVGQDGIQNQGAIVNATTGVITVSKFTNGIWNALGSLQNSGKITLTNTVGNGIGILSYVPFTNNAGAEIHLDQMLSGIVTTNTFNNAGLIRIGETGALGGYGINNTGGVAAVFNNNAGGDISVKQTGLDAVQNNANSTFNNNACARLAIFDNLNNAGTFTNAGLFTVNTTQAHTNTGTLTNNGVIEYPQGNPIPNVTNNDVIVAPITVCGTTFSPALQIGGANSFTVGTTWYSDASLNTQAGTYNQATNTFTLTNLALTGTQTLYFSINDDVNNCPRTVSIQVTIIGPIVYVTQTGAGLQNGSSWANAFSGTQVQLAINTAAKCGSQVWVAKGTYYPTADASGNLSPADPRTKTFVMKNGVAIYGGFVGNEAANYDLSLRNFTSNQTILSGDIDGTPDVVTGSGSTLSISGNGGNAYHVIFNDNNGLTNTAVLDGFTVSGGNANAGSNPNNLGGGMLINNVSPTITNCTFSHNYAGAGGGFYYSATSGSLTISRCIFSLNIGGNGGGVRNRANLALNNCQISENRTSGSGGGISNSLGSLSMTSCQVNGNDAASGFGGGINSFRPLTLSFCQINNNSSGNNGGIFQGNQQLIMTNCEVKNNRTVNQGSGINLQDVPSATLTNCEISGNVSQNSQGGIANLSFNTAALLTLINCTVANNTSVGGYRAIWTTISSSGQSATTILKNTIVANNPGGNFLQADDPNMPTLFGTVQSQGNNLDSDGSSGFINGVNGDLVNANPLFVSATDVRLQACSPAINVGDNTGISGTDLDNNPRIFNNGTVDLGAYEYQSALPTAITPTVGSNNPTTCGGTNGSITLSGFLNNTTYSIAYKKDNNAVAAANFTSSGSGVITLNDLGKGTYTDIVATYGSCVSNAATATLNDPVPPTANIGGNNSPICAGANATFTVTGTNGATLTYTLTGLAGNQTLLLDGTNQSISANNASTNVTLTLVSVIKANCNVNLMATSTVTVVPQPVGPTLNAKTPNIPTICAGTAVIATFNLGSGGVGCSDDYILIIDNGAPVAYTQGSLVGSNATNSIVIQGRRANCTAGSGCNGTTYVTLTSWNVVPQPVGPTLLAKTPNLAAICLGTTVSATFNAGSSGVGCSDDYTASIDGGAPVAYTPGSPVGANATTSIVIQGRRANCSPQTGCNGTNYVTLASWTVNPQPVGPTLLAKTPNIPAICFGTGVSATFNAGSGGVGCADNFILSIDGGPAVAYTPGSTVGTSATTSIVIQGRRAGCSAGAGCNGTSYVTLAFWSVSAQPVGPTLLAKTPNVSAICFGTGVSATFNAGSGGVGCADDYVVSIDGATPIPYTPGSTVGATASSSIVIQGRRANCAVGSGCNGTDYVTLASWSVNPLPTASISGTTAVCQNAPFPNVTFTGNGGTKPYTFTYKINAGGNLTVSTSGINTSVTVAQTTAVAGPFNYTLVSVKDANGCEQSQSGLAIITVKAPPVVSTPQTALCTGLSMTLSPTSGGTWQSSNPMIATVTEAGVVTGLLAGVVNFTFTQTSTGCSASTANVTIKPTPTSALSASKYDVCPNTEVTLNPNCSIPTSTVNWNPGAPTVTPAAATLPYIYKASCVADGCVGNESSVEVRTHRILVDMKDLDVGALPLPIVRAVKDNMEPTNQINAPTFPRRWTFIANGCDASESAVFKLSGPVNFNTIDNASTYAMFANDAGGFYSLDHPNYGNGGSFPNGIYSLTVELRNQDGVGGPFPKNRVAVGALLATRTLQFTVGSPQSIVGSRQAAVDKEWTVDSGPWTEISPNPVSNTMRLKVTEAKGQSVSVSLVDASGRTMLQRSFVPETNQHQEEFNVGDITNGMYFLRVNTAEKRATLKVVKVE